MQVLSRFQVLMSNQKIKEVPLFPEITPKRDHRKKRANSSSQRRTIDCFSHPLSVDVSLPPSTPQPVSKLRRSSSASAIRQRTVCTDDVITPPKKVSFADPLEQPPSVSVNPGHSFSFPSTSSANVPFGKSLDYHPSSSSCVSQICKPASSPGLCLLVYASTFPCSFLSLRSRCFYIFSLSTCLTHRQCYKFRRSVREFWLRIRDSSGRLSKCSFKAPLFPFLNCKFANLWPAKILSFFGLRDTPSSDF